MGPHALLGELGQGDLSEVHVANDRHLEALCHDAGFRAQRMCTGVP